MRKNITVEFTNVFENLAKLGAGKAYQRNILAKQLVKIFQYPAVLGCLLGFLFSAAMSWFNDGRYTGTELKTLALLLGLALFIIMFLYIVYRSALHKAEQIVGIRLIGRGKVPLYYRAYKSAVNSNHS